MAAVVVSGAAVVVVAAVLASGDDVPHRSRPSTTPVCCTCTDLELRVPDEPPLLGLVESTDGCATWQPLSLLGEADFHTRT